MSQLMRFCYLLQSSDEPAHMHSLAIVFPALTHCLKVDEDLDKKKDTEPQCIVDLV